MNVIQIVEGNLALDRFPYRVALFPGYVPELGDVVEVHAFDVAEAEVVQVSRRLNYLLASLRLDPMPIGSAFGSEETPDALARVPAEARWFEPAIEMFQLTCSARSIGVADAVWDLWDPGHAAKARESSPIYRGGNGVAVIDERTLRALSLEWSASDLPGFAINTHYSLAS